MHPSLPCLGLAATKRLFVGCALLWGAAAARGEMDVARPFTDGAVLQRDATVPVWGTAEAGEHVTVTFAGQTVSAIADEHGRWSVTLEPLTATAEPGTLTIEGTRRIELKDVVVGEVWFCSGQSNMEVGLERARTSVYLSPEAKADAIARIDRELAAPAGRLRLFRAGTRADDALKNRWQPCSPEALKNQNGHQGFSAVAYYFGQALAAELKVPIGLVEASIGGTTIETWTPPNGKNFVPLVEPLAPFRVRGIIWYQGESNLIAGDDGATYAAKMETLIGRWRALWRDSTLPFYYVQLPPMRYSRRRDAVRHTPEALPSLREGQAAALRVPQTGMIVTTDLAPANDLHPANKWDVGGRLARLALARTYGRTEISHRNPKFTALRVQGSQAVLSFQDVEEGLMSVDGRPLTDFVIAGEDRRFVPAVAAIQGDTVVVSSPEVSHPAAVRFGWHEDARPNLFSRRGLPATPFRTDHWPVTIVAPATPDGTPPAGRAPR